MRTKHSKSFDAWFFPVGGEVAAIVAEWVEELRRVHLMGDDDPVFPASKVEIDPQTRRFAVVGLERKVWSSTEPIRAIFREAFAAAGLPYFNPHSVPKTPARLGERICNGPEEFKAWSQNLGHDHVATTFSSYGQVPTHRQTEILRGLGKPKVERDALAEDLVAFLSARGFTASASPSA